MTEITDDDVRKFSELYKEHFGTRLSNRDTKKLLRTLLNLYKVLYGIDLHEYEKDEFYVRQFE